MKQFFQESELGHNLLLIFMSIVVGLMIGSEREYRNKSAGLRTFILVSFGSCLFTILSLKIGAANPDRLAANVLTGIGFLGAGVIFKDDNKIAGITTATTIWATSALGMSIGSGNILLGFLGALLVLIILNALYLFQVYIDNLNKVRDYNFCISNIKDIPHCIAMFQQHQLKYDLLSECKTPEKVNISFRLTGNGKKHFALIEQLRKDTVIISYQF